MSEATITNSPTPTVNSPKKGYSVFWLVATLVLLVMLLGSVCMNFGLLVTIATLGASLDIEAGDLNKKVLDKQGDNILQIKSQILVIEAQGVITSYGNPLMTNTVISPTVIEKQLKQAEQDDSIKAVILKVVSPGGEVTASDKIYQAILEFRAKSNKPIIAYFETVSASGGYYISCGCDEIIAHPTCITGSIGVIFSFFQAQELMEEKLGIQYVVFKSGAHKDIGSFAREMTDSDKKIFQDMLDEIYGRFLEIVLKARPELAKLDQTDHAAVLNIADGRIYTAKQALNLKLIDSIGLWPDAIKRSIALAKIGNDYQVIKFQQKKSLMQELMETQTANKQPSISQEVANIVENYTRPQLYYMWTGK